MNKHPEPRFDAVEKELRDFEGLACAAEVHGHFCGLACMLGKAAGPLWAATILAEADGGSALHAPIKATLENLAVTSLSALEEGDLRLKLLLPADERPLTERTESLALWCTGFLHGLGSGDSTGRHGAALKAGATADILADFAELTRAAVFADEIGEEGESAYAELVEFVRVSVQLVFEELQQIRSHPSDALTH